MLTPDQHQLAIEYRELMRTIAKTETQVAALRDLRHCRQRPWPLLGMKPLPWLALLTKL
jgi:hypothetical protein